MFNEFSVLGIGLNGRRLAKNGIYFPFYKVSLSAQYSSYAVVSNFLGVIFCWASLLGVTLTLLFSLSQQSEALFTVQPGDQCSGSADPNLRLTDPDPDSVHIVTDTQDDNKVFLLITF
jgi:hypothetical protein